MSWKDTNEELEPMRTALALLRISSGAVLRQQHELSYRSPGMAFCLVMAPYPL